MTKRELLLIVIGAVIWVATSATFAWFVPAPMLKTAIERRVTVLDYEPNLDRMECVSDDRETTPVKKTAEKPQTVKAGERIPAPNGDWTGWDAKLDKEQNSYRHDQFGHPFQPDGPEGRPIDLPRGE